MLPSRAPEIIDFDTFASLLDESKELSMLDLGGSAIHIVEHPARGFLALFNTPSGRCALVPTLP